MRLLCIGDNVVDRYLDRGTMYPGGNCVNVAVFAARGGAEAAYAGILGDDAAGQLVLAALQAEGVDTSHVVVEHGDNAYALVELIDGDREFLGSDKGVSLFDLDQRAVALAKGYDIVHTAYSQRWEDQVLRLVEAGCTVAYDFGRNYSPASIAKVPGLWLAAFSGSHLDEAGLEQVAQAALEAGAHYVLITQGADGATLWSGQQRWHQSADHVTVVDTLAAGDAYLASLIVSLADGADETPAMAKASAASARVITVWGAFGHGAPDQGAPVKQGVN